MAIIKISQKDLCSLSGVCAREVEPILTELGIPLDKKEGDELHIEITPNRPDWLSVEGVARCVSSYKTGKPKSYSIKKSKMAITIDKSVSDVRPIFAGAYITGVKLTPQILDSLIQLQEKLHDTLGRNRKKMAIGIHDAKNISPPFTYKTVNPTSIKFTPLGMDTQLNCSQILSQHEKGQKYAHLVSTKCPIIIDSKNQVLSFPPIINGELTKVTLDSKELFIDCTGTHKDSVFVTVNILAAALADRGATIHTILINKKEHPLLSPIKTTFKLKETSKLLGISLTQKDAKKHLERMGHTLEGTTARSPAYRSDILHSVDLCEDIAISIGYNNFEPQPADFFSIGKKENNSFIHQTCLGLGFFEASSWILTNQRVLENSAVALDSALRVQNPLTQEFTTMRPAIYPNMLEIFANSKSQPMPQNLYEFGPIIKTSGSAIIQNTNLCFASAHPKSNFSQIHSILKAFLDAQNIQYSLIDADINGFIQKRCAKILINSKEVGILGEIHPNVLEQFSIEQPVCIIELDAKSLSI